MNTKIESTFQETVTRHSYTIIHDAHTLFYIEFCDATGTITDCFIKDWYGVIIDDIKLLNQVQTLILQNNETK